MRRVLPPVLALVLLTGCGSDGDETAGSAPTPTATAGAPSAAASPGASPDAVTDTDIEGLEVLTEELSRGHVDGPVDYGRMPPLGGDHAPRWLACDVYDEPVPLEYAVHSLEHGAVWLAYDPGLPESDVEALARLAGRNEEYVLVSPEEGLDSRVVAVAWGRAIEASEADDPRLAQFVEAYAGGGQGGEPGVPCRGSGLTPREARGMTGTSA